MRVEPAQAVANPLNGTPLTVRNLAHYVARNTLFDASQSGTAAALPTDLAAGWAVLTEQTWRDFGFFAIQSHPILGIACQHRNHPTPRLKRLFVQFLVGCYMFYMVTLLLLLLLLFLTPLLTHRLTPQSTQPTGHVLHAASHVGRSRRDYLQRCVWLLPRSLLQLLRQHALHAEGRCLG